MCYNCGCEVWDDDMGHPENITSSDVEKAADAEGQTPEAAMRNIIQGLQKHLGQMETGSEEKSE